MYIIRLIIATALLLASIAFGVISWAFYQSSKAVPLLVLGDTGITVNIEHAAVAAAIVLFALAVATIYPKAKKRSAPRGPTPMAKDPAVESARKAAREFSLGSKPDDSAEQPAAAAKDEDYDWMLKQVPDEAEPETHTEADISELQERMDRLVNIEQNEITSDVARGLVHEYYANLGAVIRRIDDDRSLETFTRHVVGIVRNQLKLSDPRLSDNQFSIFQRKVFEGESEEILMMYAPDQTEKLTGEQKSHYGLAVDRRNWESMQRTLRAASEDWKGFSIKNGEALLRQTGTPP